MAETANTIPWEKLTTAAIAVRLKAFAPYSKFKVGAALLSTSGEIFIGCNVENASYGLSICAERSAIVSAVSAGHREFSAIAIAADPSAAPCGACRQFLVQFGAKYWVRSLSPNQPDSFRQWTTGELLPEHFEF